MQSRQFKYTKQGQKKINYFEKEPVLRKKGRKSNSQDPSLNIFSVMLKKIKKGVHTQARKPRNKVNAVAQQKLRSEQVCCHLYKLGWPDILQVFILILCGEEPCKIIALLYLKSSCT